MNDYEPENEEEEEEARRARFKRYAETGEVGDLYAEAVKQDGIAEMLEPLDDEQRSQVEDTVREFAEPWQDMLGQLLGNFDNEEAREEFVKAAAKRFSSLG